MGLAVAILAVRGAVKIKKGEKQDSNYGLEGMCLGMWINKKLSAREYNWVSFPEIKTPTGRAKRFIKQFSPMR